MSELPGDKVKHTGGCACGEIRYGFYEPDLGRMACHCRTCQYSSGGGPVFLVAVNRQEFRVTKGRPKEFTTLSDDGNHVSRVISVGDLYDRTNYTVRIENLTIRNGTLSIPQNCEGAGIFNWWSTVTLSNVVVEGNVSAGSEPQYSYGGGIANVSVMTLQGCTVQSNVANGVGGGIYNSAHGRMDIYDTTIHANQGASGGGIHNKSPCTITGSTLSINGGQHMY